MQRDRPRAWDLTKKKKKTKKKKNRGFREFTTIKRKVTKSEQDHEKEEGGKRGKI